MIDMDQAWQIIHEKTTELAQQRASNACVKDLDEIVPGDILAEEVHAADDLPPFRASVMDGYAVNQINRDVYKVVSYKSLAGSDPTQLANSQKEEAKDDA